jgi:hemin transport system permease protein
MVWLKEIWRSKLKFGLLAVAVGLLFFLLIFVNTLSSNLLDGFVGAIENNTSDLLVFDADAQATIPASRLEPAQVEAVGQVAGVSRVAPISEMSTETVLGGEETDLSLWGIEVGGPGTPDALVEGRLPGSGEALVDTSGRDAGLAVGKTFEIAGVEIEVTGVAADATYAVTPTVYVSSETWGEVFSAMYAGAAPPPINLIGVEVTAGSALEQVATDIGSLEGLEALLPTEAAAATPGVSSIKQSFGLITAITFVIVVIVVGFFFQILTVQKLRVFAVLEAIGTRLAALAGYILGQIGLLVGLGVLVGIAMLVGAAAATRDQFAISIDPVLVGWLGGGLLLASLASGITSIRRVVRQGVSGVASGGGR